MAYSIPMERCGCCGDLPNLMKIYFNKQIQAGYKAFFNEKEIVSFDELPLSASVEDVQFVKQ